ncbi:POTE ankyrin domain family member [Trichinella spiralis]|uniref:POTE ankyrin domain family member n=1 Tax=Trichinella spiralis TaxID=6334 RepID=A0ABR3KCB5_TRISP
MWKYRRLVVGRPFVRPAWSAAVVVVAAAAVAAAAAAAAAAAVCTKCLTCLWLFGDSLGERFLFNFFNLRFEQFFPMEALYAILESVHIYIPALVAIVCIVVIFYFGVASSSSTSQPPQEYLQEMRSGRVEKTKVKLSSKSTSNKLNKTSKTAKQSSTSKASSTNNNPKAKSGHVPTGAVGGQARSKGSRAREVREERANSDDVEMNEDLTNGWVTVTPRRAGDEDEMGNNDRIGQSHSAKRPASKQQKYGKVVNSNAAAELLVHSEEEIPSVKPEKKNSKKSNKAKRPEPTTVAVDVTPNAVVEQEISNSKFKVSNSSKRRKPRREQ